jgi:hypothetical protein
MNSTFLASQLPPIWGERVTLLDKGLLYQFSMDLAFELGAQDIRPNRVGLLAALVSPVEDKGYTFHVLDEVLANLNDGTVCNVPLGEVTRLHDTMLIDHRGTASLDGRILLDVEGPISVAYTGVATFAGGADRVLRAALPRTEEDKVPRRAFGSAFISLRSECPRPKYRWMADNQLFGFGRVDVQSRPHKFKSGGCTLSFSYDIYSAGPKQ